MVKAVLGVIGGSGVYDLPGLEDVREEAIASPWGEPSDALRIGRIGETQVVFLARHGRGHRLSPSGIDYRANIDAMKRAPASPTSWRSRPAARSAGAPSGPVRARRPVRRPDGRPDLVVLRQWLRRPRLDGPSGRSGPASPDPGGGGGRGDRGQEGRHLRLHGGAAILLLRRVAHYKAQGYDVIGMTNMPEAKLAREAEITYATIAMVTTSIAGTRSTTPSTWPPWWRWPVPTPRRPPAW